MSTGVKTHRITDPNDDTRFVDVDPYVIEGVGKSGWRYNQITDTIFSSYNVSSIVDDSTGNFDVNFTNSYSDAANITPEGTTRFTDFSGTGILAWDSFSTSSVSMNTKNTSGTNSDGSSAGTTSGGVLA
jgi:hypothetical protein